MLRKAFLPVTVALICLGISSNAFATDPYVCDPAKDAEKCQCPTSGLDACYSISVSNLTSPDDPLVLRDLANITSSWNSDFNGWDVYVDATGLSAAGVITLHSNEGQWNSIAELHTYIGNLIGQEVDDCSTATKECYFPKMRIHQTGVTSRYD